MRTVAQTNGTINPLTAALYGTTPSADAFLAAVRQVSELAHAKLPAPLHGNLERATALVLTGKVWREEDGTWQVEASDGQSWYRPNGHCTCRNAATADGGWCKHRLAAALYRRAAERLADAPVTVEQALAGERPPAACEVPAIASTVLTIDGRRVEVKLCDTDDARLLARLRAILAQYPVGTAAEATPGGRPGPAAGEEAQTCPVHHVEMHESSNDRGSWWSHRLDDGTWCKGRTSRKAQGR